MKNRYFKSGIQMLDLAKEYKYMRSGIDKAIKGVLKHQQWILGSEVKELEEETSRYLKVKHCIGVASGTDALLLSLRALAIKIKGKEFFDREDEIITTPFTFVATAEAILRSGATPVFVDIEGDTFNINPKMTKESITKNTVGIVPVHLFGCASRMDEIMRMAQENNLFIIEDVAQAFGGKYKENRLGAIGTLGAFSFFPSKNLGGFGDGGLISAQDSELTEIIKMLRNHGGKDKNLPTYIGYNSRLDTVQAAILLAKLKFVEVLNKKRRKIARIYNEELKNIKLIKTPIEPPYSYHVYHQYTIRVLNNQRDGLKDYLVKHNIHPAIYYPYALHKMKIFENRCIIRGNLDITERVSKEVLSLPIEPLFDIKTLKIIIGAIRSFCKKV